MKIKLTLCWTVVLWAVSPFLFAHEFWIQPSNFFASIGEEINLRLLVGDNFTGERWGGKMKRITELKDVGKSAVRDLSGAIYPEDSLLSVRFALKTNGTHLLYLTTNNSFISLPAAKFNAYLKEDGLDDALTFRGNHNQLEEPSREQYRRCVKTLIQVGKQPDSTFARRVGMTLEIVPLQNPYALRHSDSMDFKILLKGKPLFHALAHSWRRDKDSTITVERRTNKRGIARFAINKPGVWLISVVAMIPAEDKQIADWQSLWGSLTFETRR